MAPPSAPAENLLHHLQGHNQTRQLHDRRSPGARPAARSQSGPSPAHPPPRRPRMVGAVPPHRPRGPVPPRPGNALRLAKQAPPPEHLIGIQVVALGDHRHRNPRLMGLRHDLTLLRLAPPPATATNRSAAISARLLLGNRHQPSVHLNRSGHLRSIHFPIAHSAKALATRTGGLRRRVTHQVPGIHCRNFLK